MLVDIEWRFIGPRSQRRDWTRCLYAYVHPAKHQLLYIGKADGTTVRGRFDAPDKDKLFRFLDRKLGITDVRVSVGDILLEEDIRLSRQLLADIESLLIKRTLPVGNVNATKSRISRPGLEVVCSGDWPYHQSRFRDIG